MKTNRSYWACQVIGWGVYVILGLTMAAQQVGWKASVVAGYVLFFFYSIALTDLLRREMKRRHWLEGRPVGMVARLVPAVVGIATVQTLLVVGISYGLKGSVAGYGRPEYLMSTWMGITAA